MGNETWTVVQVGQSTTLSSVSAKSVYICQRKTDSLEQYWFIYIMKCYFLPALSFSGLVANSMSLAILRRNGLQRSSNVLLFGLVVADSMNLLQIVDFGAIIYYFGPNKLSPFYCGFQYDDTLNHYLAFSSLSINFLANWGLFTSTILPVVITMERLLAIFRPVTFKSIVTSEKVKIIVVCCFIFWIPLCLAVIFYCKIYDHKVTKEMTWTFIIAEAPEIFAKIQIYVVNSLTSWGTLAIVVTGCVVIGVKVKLTLRRRRSLTSSQSKLNWSPKTTRTLILTCIVFSVTHFAHALYYVLYDQMIGTSNPVQSLVRNEVGFLLYAINASSNLFVYILSNKKMCRNFMSMMRMKQR